MTTNFALGDDHLHNARLKSRSKLSDEAVSKAAKNTECRFSNRLMRDWRLGAFEMLSAGLWRRDQPISDAW